MTEAQVPVETPLARMHSLLSAKAVVIPKALPDGGSPNMESRIVKIENPENPSEFVILDRSRITPELMQLAKQRAGVAPGTPDAAFHIYSELAKIIEQMDKEQIPNSVEPPVQPTAAQPEPQQARTSGDTASRPKRKTTARVADTQTAAPPPPPPPPPPPSPGELLHIPFLAEKPQKPAQRATFNFGVDGGTVTARYHAILVKNDMIVLIYDTRYEDGVQYAPPVTGPDKTFTVTLPDNDRSWTVCSLGVQFAIGCLDITVLFAIPAEPA